MDVYRRQLLSVIGGGAVGALAGCSAFGGDGSTSPDDGARATTTPGAGTVAPVPSERVATLHGDDAGDAFGRSVAVSADGTTALVGASEDEDPNGELAGSAAVYERGGGSWTERTTLAPDDGDSRDLFGRSVALSADGATALVGADNDEDPNGQGGGSAYVFRDADGSWSQRAKVAPEDGPSGATFGDPVALSADGTTAVVGAYQTSSASGGGIDHGRAYVFTASGGDWREQATLQPAAVDAGDLFGSAVAVSADGTTAVVAAVQDEDPNGENGGSAYVFDAAGGAWRRRATLARPDGDTQDFFGGSVALSADGTTAVVTAANRGPSGDLYEGGESPAAYVFERDGDDWTHRTTVAPDPADVGFFGSSLAVCAGGRRLVVGAAERTGAVSAPASVLAYERTDDGWTREARLSLDAPPGSFGDVVAASRGGGTVVVGAPNADANGEFSGSAYVFE